jgi:hypothetical protein
VCRTADACTSTRLASEPSPSVFPQTASARVAGSLEDRDVATTSVFTFVNPDQTNTAISALLGTLTRVTTPAGGELLFAAFNPPALVIATATGPVGAAPGTALGQPTLAITSTGQLMAAWVEHLPARAILRTRTYRIRVCP